MVLPTHLQKNRQDKSLSLVTCPDLIPVLSAEMVLKSAVTVIELRAS